MAKRVLEVIACDVCGNEGKRYIITYPDGIGEFILDRCERHNKKLEALKQEKGEWKRKKTRSRDRSSFTVSDPDALLREYGGDENK